MDMMEHGAGTDHRVMLVTTVKDEGPNILEWVAYHRMIGFTDIVVFQNDSFDNTERSLMALRDMGVIQYYNNEYSHPGNKQFQNRAYRRASRLAEYADAQWCMALDGDEFLQVNTGQGRVQDLIAACPDADELRLNWRVFGNCHLRHLDDRLVTERFITANERDLPSRFPMPVKTLFRTRCFQLPGIHLPKRAFDEQAMIRTGSGTPIEDVTVRGFQVSDPFPYKLAQVNHYMVRDSDSFLMKSARGSSSHPDRAIALDYWRKRNLNKATDARLASQSETLHAEMSRLDLASDGMLGRSRRHALRQWRERIAELKTQPEMQALWEQLV